MKMTVHQVAKLTGVSVRTLHYYDEIGLLPPSEITPAGYRLYGAEALERLQQILFFRELEFPLKEVKQILDSPAFDKNEALAHHKELLMLRRGRINRLIALVDRTLKGENKMSFEAFDLSEIEAAQKQYAQEARERWGDSDAYQESARKTAAYTKADWAAITAQAGEIYQAMAAQMEKSPDHPAVQALVARWQQHITDHYYHCTKEILAGLGEMYASDPRFIENIDRFQPGLARFFSEAIRVYCA